MRQTAKGDAPVTIALRRHARFPPDLQIRNTQGQRHRIYSSLNNLIGTGLFDQWGLNKE